MLRVELKVKDMNIVELLQIVNCKVTEDNKKLIEAADEYLIKKLYKTSYENIFIEVKDGLNKFANRINSTPNKPNLFKTIKDIKVIAE